MEETNTNGFKNVSIKTSENPHKRNNYGSALPDTKDFTWPSPNESVHGKNITDTLTISEIVDETWLKRRIWINIGLLNSAIFFLMMGIAPLAILQSSMNSENGLGVASLAVKNGFMVVGSIVAPSMIKKFGCKSAIVIGTVLYITYVPANFYPSFFTLIPFAMLAGLGYTVQLVAYKVYIARLGHLYADMINMDADRMNSRLYALMVFAVKSSSALGNFIASSILNAGVTNQVTDYDQSRLQVCGINYCNQEFSFKNDSSVIEPQVDGVSVQIYFLIGVCTASSLVSVLLFALMDPLKKFGISSMPDKGPTSPFSVLKDLLTAMKDPRHILFIPMTIALNGGDSFWSADFTKAFVSCSISMANLGYVSLWNGIGGSISCILGWFNSKKMRSLPVISATLLQMVVLTGLFYWIPSTILMVNYWTLSMFGVIFFIGSGIRHFIAPVLISVVFKDNLETAFSVFHFWCFVSSTLFYGWSSFLCMTFKIYFLLITLALSFIGYIAMEVIVNRNPASNDVKYKKLDDDDIS